MRKTYILDTSVLIHDPKSFRSFHGNDVVIPVSVLGELDKLKTFPNEAGKNARICVRLLDEITKNGDVNEGIKIENDIVIRIDNSSANSRFGDPSYADNQILWCAYSASKNSFFKKKTAILVSKDINLRVRARAYEIDSEDYETDKTSAEDLYMGHVNIVNNEIGELLISQGFIECSQYSELSRLNPNQCIYVESSEGKGLALGRRIDDKVKIIRSQEPWGLKSKNKEQAMAIDLLMDRNIPLVSLIGRAGTGKAQPLDSDVLTPNGFKKMGDLKVGDLVSTPDGKSAPILAVFPQGEKDIYKVSFSDGTSAECCEDHLWLTKTSKERDYKKEGAVRDTKEIAKTLTYGKYNKKNHSIPITKPVEFSKKNLPIKPYTFGALLGDGSFRHHLTLTSDDEQIVNLMNEELNEVGIQVKKTSKKYSYNIVGLHERTKYFKQVKTIDSSNNENIYSSAPSAARYLKCSVNGVYKSLSQSKKYLNLNWIYLEKKSDNVLLSYLKDVGLWMKKSEDKFIPDEYKHSSISDRVELLQGLLDTDGTIDKSGLIEYYTVSKKLAEDFRWIVESLGGTASTKIKKTHYTKNNEKINCQDCYRISVVLPNEITPFKLQRKLDRVVDRIKYFARRYIVGVDFVAKKQAQCILIDHPEHLYLTNNFIVTHNTLCAIGAALEMVLERKMYKKLIVYRPIHTVGKELGFLPGDIDEKLMPQVVGLFDSFEFLFSSQKGDRWKTMFEMYREKGIIEINAIAYIRGRSIPNALIILDEAQNVSQNEIKTLLSRLSDGSKAILTGDIEQIDNSSLDAMDNGLTRAVEAFKGSKLSGHVTLTKGERSELATEVARLL